MGIKDFFFLDYFTVISSEACQDGEFGLHCSYKGQTAFVESGYDDQTGRPTINIYY